jgi:hypothetical protein
MQDKDHVDPESGHQRSLGVVDQPGAGVRPWLRRAGSDDAMIVVAIIISAPRG